MAKKIVPTRKRRQAMGNPIVAMFRDRPTDPTAPNADPWKPCTAMEALRLRDCHFEIVPLVDAFDFLKNAPPKRIGDGRDYTA